MGDERRKISEGKEVFLLFDNDFGNEVVGFSNDIQTLFEHSISDKPY